MYGTGNVFALRRLGVPGDNNNVSEGHPKKPHEVMISIPIIRSGAFKETRAPEAHPERRLDLFFRGFCRVSGVDPSL
jgi:hypothetical protein